MAKKKSKASLVREPAVNYYIPESKPCLHIAGSSAVLSTISEALSTGTLFKLSPFEKMGIIREGVTKEDLENLKQAAELDYDQLAQALGVTRATLINKKGDEKFGAGISEKIISLADIYSYGYEVFEDTDAFNNWMFRPNRALGGQKPYDLLNNQYGREEVKNLIGRIDYGVYS